MSHPARSDWVQYLVIGEIERYLYHGVDRLLETD